MNRFSALIKGTPRGCLSLYTTGGLRKRVPSMDQDMGSHQTLNQLSTLLTLDLQFLEL